MIVNQMPEKVVANFSCAQMQENNAHRETGIAPCRKSYTAGQQRLNIVRTRKVGTNGCLQRTCAGAQNYSTVFIAFVRREGYTYNKKHGQIQSNINNDHEEYLTHCPKVVYCLPVAIKLSVQRFPRCCPWNN